MARPGLMRHRKFIRLARELGSRALARGYLEIIWEACYEAGDPSLGNAADVEFLAGWDGEPGRFARLLLEAGFVDLLDEKNFIVHDLFDHAPDYVRRRMIREAERVEKGKTLHDVRAKAGRKGGKAKASGNCLANDQQTPANEIHLPPREVANDEPPSPSPSPSPSLRVEGQGEISDLAPSLDLAQKFTMQAGELGSMTATARARAAMRDVLTAGYTFAEIEAEIMRRDRITSEHPGQFARRMIGAKNGSQTTFSRDMGRDHRPGVSPEKADLIRKKTIRIDTSAPPKVADTDPNDSG